MAPLATMLTALFVLIFATACSAAPSWKKVPVTGSYVGRGEAAVSLCGGNKVCVLGGRGSSPVGIFDTEKLEWTRGKNPPFEIHHFQALQGDDDCVWIVGAWTGPFPAEGNVDNMLRYCPNTDEWINGPAIARPRGAGGALLYKGAIYLVSGNVGGHNPDAMLVPWFDKYDLATGQWSQLPNIPHPRDHFHAVILNDKLYVAGGRDSSGELPDFFNDVETKVNVYDFATGEWSVLDDFDRPRGGTFSTVFGNSVYVMGGEGQGRAWTEVDVLSGTKFAPAEDMPTPRHGAGAVTCNGAIWVAGGVTVIGGGAPALDTVAFYDGDTPPVCNAGTPSTDAPTTTEATTATTAETTTTTPAETTTTEPATTAPVTTTTTGMSTTSVTTTTVTTTTSTSTESIPTTTAPSIAPSPSELGPIPTPPVVTSPPPSSSSVATAPPSNSPVVGPTILETPTNLASPSAIPSTTDVFETSEPTSSIEPSSTAEPTATPESVEPMNTPNADTTVKISPNSPEATGDADPTDEGNPDNAGGTESPEPEDDDPVCFPSNAMVELSDGSMKMVGELKIGDHVKVEHPNGYSPVFFFSHHHHDVRTEMVRIETNLEGIWLSLSPGHLLYVNDKLAKASTVRVGDKVSVGHSETREAVVRSTSRVITKGLHNPHTLHGDIIVNGVVASTFTSTVHPTMARALLAPFRMLYHAFGSHSAVTKVNHAVLRTLDYTVWRNI